MIIGKLPGQNLDAEARADYSVPVSSYYAEVFADLAKERGFDGWLLNVEVGLQGGAEQARALAAWVTLLQQEMFKRVGPHSQVIWYDSVTVRGDLWWQDRLNALNLPFFLNSGGIFTNYWVRYTRCIEAHLLTF
jgi:mannosyl-glycoprotein endo-beta-N-acetylglucosaminidase